MNPIGHLKRLSGNPRTVGNPVGNDIVVGFFLTRYLNQLDLPFSPTADRRNPSVGSQLLMRLQILIAIKLTVSLQKAKAERVIQSKITHTQLLGIS